MSSVILPFVPALANYKFSTTILDVVYVFVVRWNTRDEAWYFDVLDDSERVIRRGIKVVLGAYMGRMCVSAPFNTGAFVAIDTSRAQKDPTFDDLGTRVQIHYLDALTINALIDGAVT